MSLHDNMYSESWVVPRGRTDVRTEMTNLRVAFRNFSNAPNNVWNKTNWCHYFNFIYILPYLDMFRAHRPILRRVHTAVHTTIGSVSVLLWPCALCVQSTWPEQYRQWTNGCVNSCVNSPEDGPVGPKHVEVRQYINKIEIVTSVGFYSI